MVEPFGGQVYEKPLDAWAALRGSPSFVRTDGSRVPRRIGALGKLRERLSRQRWRELGGGGKAPFRAPSASATLGPASVTPAGSLM